MVHAAAVGVPDDEYPDSHARVTENPSTSRVASSIVAYFADVTSVGRVHTIAVCWGGARGDKADARCDEECMAGWRSRSGEEAAEEARWGWAEEARCH